MFKSIRTCEAAFGGPQCSRLWVHVNLYSSASEGKILGCGLDSSVFCPQSTCLSLLPCGFSTSTFVKGSRRRLPIKLRAVLRPDSLSTCAGTKFTLVIQSPFRLVSYLLRAHFCESGFGDRLLQQCGWVSVDISVSRCQPFASWFSSQLLAEFMVSGWIVAFSAFRVRVCHFFPVVFPRLLL